MDAGIGPTGDKRSYDLAPVATLVRCDGEGIVSRRPLSGGTGGGAVAVFAGLIGVALLGAAGMGIRELFRPGGSFALFFTPETFGWGVLVVAAIAVFAGLGFFVALAGYHLAGSVTLHIDPTSGTYRSDEGWCPVRRVRRGSAAEFTRLSLRRYADSPGVITLHLHGTDPKRPSIPLHTGKPGATTEYGQRVAGLLGLSLVVPAAGERVAAAPSPSATSTATLTRWDAEAVVSERPLLSDRLVGILPMLLGAGFSGPVLLQLLAAMLHPADGRGGDASGEILGRVLAFLFIAFFGLLFVAVGYFIFGPRVLHIAPATKAYRLVEGWRPLCRVKEGDGREEFDRLTLRDHAGGGAAPVTTLRLHWKDAKREPFVLHTSGREEASERARALAALLGLPLVDENAEPTGVPPDRKPGGSAEAWRR
jgi:hypothetical protein